MNYSVLKLTYAGQHGERFRCWRLLLSNTGVWDMGLSVQANTPPHRHNLCAMSLSSINHSIVSKNLCHFLSLSTVKHPMGREMLGTYLEHCPSGAHLEQSCCLGSKTLSFPVPPSPTATAVVLWRRTRQEPRDAQHSHSLLPEDLVAPIALYSASSRLLYPNNHGAVCTRAQLELVMTLWTHQGETMRTSPSHCFQIRPPWELKHLLFFQLMTSIKGL